MFRFFFMVQAITYLLLMPILHEYLDSFYRPPLIISIIGIICLLIGFILLNFIHPISQFDKKTHGYLIVTELKARPIVPLAIGFVATLYIYVSISNGLWNRRQGSEFMADVYGNLPFIELAILRIYEIIFIPTAVIFLFGKSSLTSRVIILLILSASLPFMGIEESRGKILAISITLLSFVKIESFKDFLFNNFKTVFSLIFAVGIFIYGSIQRATYYARAEDYFFYEIVQRFDGLFLATQVRDLNYLNYIGSFDFAMFAPLVSRLSFIEAGRIAKLEGITSTKQYFLKFILNSNKIDASNSIILDPLYFSGLTGLVITFTILGYFIANFDRYIAQGRLFSSRLTLSVLLAFITSFAMIEVDYLGALTSFLQNFLIIFPVIALMLRSHNVHQDLEENRLP